MSYVYLLLYIYIFCKTYFVSFHIMAVHPQFDGERAYALASLYVPLTDLQRYAYLCYEAADEYFEAEMAPFSVFRRRRRRQAYNKWDVAY